LAEIKKPGIKKTENEENMR